MKYSGIWGIGVATRSAVLNSVPITANCWVLRQDGQIVANGEMVGKLDEPVEEGDCIVGPSFNKIFSNFFVYPHCFFAVLGGRSCMYYPITILVWNFCRVLRSTTWS